MRDPAEGVGPDGCITTGVEVANIRPPFTAVVQVAVRALRVELGEALLSVWCYGSVATGQAVSPTSDLDLVALTGAPAVEGCGTVGARLAAAHRGVVREVAVGGLTPEELHADGRAGHAARPCDRARRPAAAALARASDCGSPRLRLGGCPSAGRRRPALTGRGRHTSAQLAGRRRTGWDGRRDRCTRR